MRKARVRAAAPERIAGDSGLLETVARHSASHPDMLPTLFRMVAGRLRTRVLEASEARLVAGWFDRLAAGERPESVFRSKPGRPRSANHYDVAWIVHLNIEANMDKSDVYRLVGKKFGLKPGTVRNIHSRLKSEIASLHEK